MAVVRIDNFTGIMPAVAPRKLPGNAATIAEGCRFESGDLAAYRAVNRAPLESSTHGSAASQPVGRELGPADTSINSGRLFRHVPMGAPDRPSWLLLAESPSGTRAMTHVAPTPVAGDTHDRIYWSRSDSYPRVCSAPNQAKVRGSQPLATAPRLGVPRPATKPAPTANTSIVSQASIITINKTNPATVVVPGTSTFFKVGQRVRVEITYPSGVNDPVGMKSVAGKEFIIGSITPASNNLTIQLRGADTSRDENLEPGSTALLRRVFSDSDLLSRSYVYTFVTTFGEEGMPSPPSDIIDVADDIPVTVTFTYNQQATVGDGYTNIASFRLYRSETGQTGTEYFLVREQGIANGVNTTVDDKSAVELGELCPSTEWAPPPIGMRGIGLMPNGIMAGFKDNAMLFSEPYQPHAWPDRYRRTTDRPIVGWAVFGQSAVVATQGRPYLVTGSDPASMSLQQLTLEAPCLGNGGGVVSTGGGVMFPTQDGLAYVSGGEQRILTQRQIEKDQWIALWENGMEAVWWDGRYIAFSTNTNKPTLCIRPMGEGVEIVTLPGIRGRSPVRDTLTDRLFFIGTQLTNTNIFNTICEFDPQLDASQVSAQRTNYRWRSKLFSLPKEESMSVMEVAGDLDLSLSRGVTVSVLTPTRGSRSVTPAPGQTAVTPNQQAWTTNQMEVVFSQFIADIDPFRLPPIHAREWYIELNGSARIESVTLASSMDEIRSV